MNTKLTLSIDEDCVEIAKTYAKRHNTSVSKLFEQFIDSLGENSKKKNKNIVRDLQVPYGKQKLKKSECCKIHIDVREDKADFVMEMLENFPFVQTKYYSREKARFMEEFAESLRYVKKVEQGKAKPRPVEDLLNEL